MEGRSEAAKSFSVALFAVTTVPAETAKLNGRGPDAYIAAVLDRMTRGPMIDRLEDLLPWNIRLERAV